MRKIIVLMILLSFSACVSTKNTIQNIDNQAPIPTLTKQNSFILKTYSKDAKYGYNKDFPINVFYKNSKDENLNAERFLRALAGPNGEGIKFKKLESCCPFPSTHSELGAGFLDVYQLTYPGLNKPKILYFNIYERGILEVPLGFTIRNP